MAGVFGFIISGVQTVALEREALAEVEWTQSIVLFTIGYALRYVLYGMPFVLPEQSVGRL